MDNCLKDTLIRELRESLFAQTHVLKYDAPPNSVKEQEVYQRNHFMDMFDLLSSISSKRNIILNRSHLGEYVYAPRYRGYDGDWVFELERDFIQNTGYSNRVALILLYDSDNSSLARRDDGKSLGKPEADSFDYERIAFLDAFEKSNLPIKVKFDLSDYVLNENPGEIDVRLISDKILKVLS